MAAVSMDLVHTIADLRACTAVLRRGGRPVGFVPTMGALHAGHASLIRASVARGDRTVVSIFVNPTQFGPSEDYDAYPRPMEADLDVCRREGASCVFAPSVAEVYPEASKTRVQVAGLTDALCGSHRPGHFDGVTLVVAKLFNMVLPDRAYFGQKDAQQGAVIRRMTADLNWPIEVVMCPTVREADGLALSSRNKYLSPAERTQATSLHKALSAMRDRVAAGERDAAALKAMGREIIASAGACRIDYVDIVDPETVEPMETLRLPALAAVAVHVGPARLIDNMMLEA